MNELQERILKSMDLTRQLSEEEIHEAIDLRMKEEIRKTPLDLLSREKLHRNIFYEIRQLGILQSLIENPEITEIMVNGTSGIFIETKGKLKKLDICFESREKLTQVIWQITADCNRAINDASPIVDARLKDGARVNVVLDPVAINGPILTVRRFPKTPITMDQLIELQSITCECRDWLKQAVQDGANILVCGGTGSGKTTFLNVLSQYIPSEERVITIEDSAELQLLGIPNLIRLETRNANVEGCKEITIRDLIRTSLRMRPDSLMMKKRKSKHNKKGLTIPRSLADDALGDLVLLLHRKIIKVGQKCLDLGALIFCVFQGCRVPSFFLGELRLFPFQLLKLDVQLLDLGHDILRGGGLCRRGQCAGEAVDLLLCLFYIFS
jgi:pilus assembly protein CpaF